LTLLTADQPLKNSIVKPEESGYKSNVLQMFLEGLHQRDGSHLLDLGLISGNNINFFLRWVNKLSVCDMFHYLDRERRRRRPAGRLEQHFDFPPLTFDGILLWNLFDYVDNQTAVKLVQRCHKSIKPGGRLIVIVQGDPIVFPVLSTFAIGENFRLYPRPQPHMSLPLQRRQNREILTLLTPFSFAKSFLFRNGIKEYLFQRDEDSPISGESKDQMK
jgi:SAM-dependent methyltransferase|tara:strand:- start:3983 stop:4633 length:651 start_codon:yes stop_codon:yes gene_type:complete